MADSTYPSLREFQNAHRKLLREYISAIDVASSLPFFVNLFRLLVPHEKEDAFARLNRRSFPLFAPLTWKPFVRFLVELHIKAKMGELIVAYNQLSLRLPEGKKFDPLRDALKLAIAECNQLSDTLTTWKSGKTLMATTVPILLGWLTSWLGTDDLVSALPRLGIEIQQSVLTGSFGTFLQLVVWFFASLGFLLLLLNQAFEGKRALFLPTWVKDRSEVMTHNIYASEDALFKLMRLHKPREFPLDVIAFVIFFLFAGAVFLLRFLYYASSILLINLVALPVGILLVIWIVRIPNRRWN